MPVITFQTYIGFIIRQVLLFDICCCIIFAFKNYLRNTFTIVMTSLAMFSWSLVVNSIHKPIHQPMRPRISAACIPLP